MRNQHVNETAAKTEGEMARFHFSVSFELWFLAIFGNETNLKTQTSKSFMQKHLNMHDHHRVFVSGQFSITGRPGIFAFCLTSLSTGQGSTQSC